MRINLKNILVIAYFLITLFLFAFVNFNGATAFENMLVPYIDGHVIVIHYFISVLILLAFIFLSLRCKIKIDVIIVCLLIKCLLDAVPFFNNPPIEYFWFYAITLSSAITYFLFININMTKKIKSFFKTTLIFFGVIICLQVIYTYFSMEYNFFDIKYKSAMVIPYGGTNIIASILIPILAMIFYSSMKKYHKGLFALLFFVAIFLTKSRGGIILTFLLLLLLLYISLGHKKNKIIKRFLLLLMFVLFAFALLQNSNVETLLSGYTINKDNITMNSLSSNRIEGWIEILKEVLNNNLFFGVGMKSLSGVGSGAHNIIIDIIYKCGVLGTLNYFTMFFILEKRGRYLFKKRHCIYYMMVMIIYTNALFEVCYFSYACDVMLWIFIGLMMNEYYESTLNINKGDRL